jgi:hypothetical protein
MSLHPRVDAMKKRLNKMLLNNYHWLEHDDMLTCLTYACRLVGTNFKALRSANQCGCFLTPASG